MTRPLEPRDRVEVNLGKYVELGTVLSVAANGDAMVQLDRGDLDYKPPPGRYPASDLRRVTGCAATEL